MGEPTRMSTHASRRVLTYPAPPMDAREVLYTARAMRRIKPDRIPDEVIARIIDAGVRAPTGGNRQDWRFVAVTDRAKVSAIGELHRNFFADVLARYDGQTLELAASDGFSGMTAGVLHAAKWQADHFDETPLVICAYATPIGAGPSIYPAMWSMCLAARAEGVGSTFTTLLAMVAPAQVDDILGVPADSGYTLQGILPMGYPLGKWGVAPRMAAHEVTFADTWGTPPAWTATPLR